MFQDARGFDPTDLYDSDWETEPQLQAGGPEKRVASPSPDKKVASPVPKKTSVPKKNQAVVTRIRRNTKTDDKQKHLLMVNAMTKKGLNLGVGDLVGMYEHVENLKKEVPEEEAKQEGEGVIELPSPQTEGVVQFRKALEMKKVNS